MRRFITLRRAAALALALAVGPMGPIALRPARADVLDKVGNTLTKLEGEASDLERGIQPPSAVVKGDDVPRRRLVEARVAYGIGNYADASILLYDVVEHYPSSTAYRESVFLLADSLFMKGDYNLARKYFRVIVNDFGENDPNYPRTLERLLDLSLKLQDPDGVPDLLARLDRIPAARQLPSAAYARGKYAYYSGAHDDAIRVFTAIGQDSPFYFQARYFLGASYIAKDELAQAAKTYYDLLKVAPKSDDDKRVVELTHMALGRIHYHRDQPSEAIDQYLMVSRKSDLFDDALYEIAFVYVKSRQFDKALRALDLLEMATGGSCSTAKKRVNTAVVMPEVCILKGNLSIRKAQTFIEDGKGNPVSDYANALAVFENTRNAYQAPRAELDAVVASNEDPAKFFATITQDRVFEGGPQLSAVSRKYLREEPDVARVVNVTADLATIRKDLEETEALLDRLDLVIAGPGRVKVFPTLAEKRAKLMDIRQTLLDFRLQVAAQEKALVSKYTSGQEKAEYDALVAKRESLAREYAALAGTGSYEERIAKARARYDELDKRAHEVEIEIHSLEAQLVALEKYYKDTKDQPGGSKMPPEVFDQNVKEIKAAIAELRAALDELRREIAIARDGAGMGDEIADEQGRLYVALVQAANDEHAFVARIKPRMSAADVQKMNQIEGLLGKIAAIEAVVTRADARIDSILDTELAGVRAQIQLERDDLNKAKGLLVQYENENLALGGEVIGGSFKTVSRKFYEITVRAEVGVIDVSWAQKEAAEDNYNRIEIDSAREKRVLENEFSEVSQEPAPGDKAATPAGEGGQAPEGGNAP
jgi:TolA-binding protein